MKRILLTSFSVLIGSIAPLDAAPLKVRSLTEQSTVSIASIHRRVVKVRVPAGFTSVTLEVCTSLKRGEWKQVATKAVPSTPGIVEFQLERAVGRRFLRVSGTTASLLPDETNQPALFLADPAATANGPFASGGTPAATTGEMLTLSSSNAAFGAGVQSDSAARAVSESDIWRLSGERLYFYNSLRGLQVFDIADPDSPAMLGQLRTHGTGDQMYLLNSGHVALMTHNSNWSGINGYTSSLIIADVSQGAPKEVARAEFNGWLRESRLVGKVLYLVSESYWSQTGGLQVTSFDLSNPEKPIKRDTLNLDSWSAVISATNRYLFVARTTSEDWTRSQIEIIDISSPVGILKKAGTIRTAGIVNDKFKMRLEGETFTVVSAIPRRWQGQTSTASRTAVETFSLKNPFSPVALGNLELGLGESVRATRFDDDRLYVVTFFTVDPLWVVDLSKPAQPKILGELTVPGFSSYIEPLGDRLVSVGQVDGKAAVSLFDVTDPTHPKTLSQLPLGEGNYSYSEANWNEKAFNVIPEENLILVPYSGYDATNGYATRVQLLDLTREKLTKRGIIDHSFAARRTAVVGDRIVAVSSTDLVTVDFADRDKPKVTSDVEIAWHVDQVFLSGGYLLQIGTEIGWNRYSQPTLTVSRPSTPDASLNVLNLDPTPVVGATVRDGRLYVAQQNQKSHPYYGGIIFLGTTNAATGNGGTEPSQALTVSVYDLKKLPEVSLLGKTTAAVDFNSYSTTRLQASWPAPGILVWTRPQNYRPWWRWYVTMDMPSLNPPPAITLFADTRVAVNNFAAQSDTAATLGFAATDSIAIHPYPRGDEGGIEGAVFDVSSPNAPLLASKLEIRTGATTDWSEVFTSEGKLYVSSMAQPEIVIAKENPEAAGSLIPKEVPRAGRHFMKVVSFDGPTKPTISAEINIPGRLVGVARFGALLFTNGPRYSAQLIPTQERAIHASSFDGTSVRFLDQIPFSGGSFAMDGETTLINLPGTAEPALKPTVQLWRLNAEDKFQLESTITTEVYANLAVIQGIAIVGFNPTQHLYNVSDPANPVDLGVLKNFGWSSLTPQNSVAEPARGVWGASGDYGVSFKEFNQ